MKSDFSDILYEQKSGWGVVTLNRPQAYNALSLEMCQSLIKQLTLWQQQEDIHAVMFLSSSERAFCAGGDIRMLYENGIEKSHESLLFFDDEYTLNPLIFHYPKPIVSFWQGIVMGGGLGLSQHTAFRVADSSLHWAMPEVGIGFFPDVGVPHVLSRLADGVGMFLAMTGAVIGATEAQVWGLSTHSVAVDNWQACQAALFDLDHDNMHDAIQGVLDVFHLPYAQGALLSCRDIISQCFQAESPHDIVNLLQKRSDPWSQQTASSILQQCPLSVMTSYYLLKAAQSSDFDNEMQREYKICEYFLKQPCLYEGIRAAIIDKDRSPNWPGAGLMALSQSMLPPCLQC